MWITQTAYLELQKALMTAIAERDAIRQQQAAITTTNDWLMHRVTQLERERAKMIEVNYGVKVDVPVIEKQPESTLGRVSGTALDFNQSISFNDMGDVEALRQGIGWDDKGNLMFGITHDGITHG